MNPQIELTDTVEVIANGISVLGSNSSDPIPILLKPTAACLPLFFGKANACLMNPARRLKELNPQVGGNLKILAESPAFVENVVAMHVNHKNHQAELVRGVTGLQDHPEGKQILLFFKSQRSATIKGQDLDNVVELRSKYFKLAGTMARKVPAPLAITFDDGLSRATKGR